MPCRPILTVAILALSAGTGLAGGTVRGAPDVLILGDSQLTFGAGAAFLDAVGAMAGQCGLEAGVTTGVIGVRSSAITDWTATAPSEKSAICDLDSKWKVNAGAYGTLSQGENPYVQIGYGEQFQLCKEDQSPLRTVFADGYYDPDLVIFFMMGNATKRWAEEPGAALQDVRELMADLPQGQRCVFMTSAPPYREKNISQRQTAQDNIERAFAAIGSHCSFVPGFTTETIRENRGNAANFRRKASGVVKDGFHPTETGARRFLNLRRPALCAAIAAQFGLPGHGPR